MYTQKSPAYIWLSYVKLKSFCQEFKFFHNLAPSFISSLFTHDILMLWSEVSKLYSLHANCGPPLFLVN